MRGYGYESLAPTNGQGQLAGGRHLVALSAEAMHPIHGDDWFGAVFVDSGNAFDRMTHIELKTGAGVGVRWRSPIGLVRVDVAYPLDAESPVAPVAPRHRSGFLMVGIRPGIRILRWALWSACPLLVTLVRLPGDGFRHTGRHPLGPGKRAVVCPAGDGAPDTRHALAGASPWKASVMTTTPAPWPRRGGCTWPCPGRACWACGCTFARPRRPGCGCNCPGAIRLPRPARRRISRP